MGCYRQTHENARDWEIWHRHTELGENSFREGAKAEEFGGRRIHPQVLLRFEGVETSWNILKPHCQDLSDPETGSSASTEVAGGEEISTLNISDPDVDTEDALEWDVLQDVIHRSKAVTGPRICFVFFSAKPYGLTLWLCQIDILNL